MTGPACASNLKKFILDTLFPIACLGCGEKDLWLCEPCARKIPPLLSQHCPHCEKVITPQGRICFNCQSPSTLAGMLVAASYQEPLVSQLIHFYKYRFIPELSLPLGNLLLREILNSELPLPDLLLPVPLHSRRLRWRGFNQAELLANYLGENLTPGFPLPVRTDLLQRQRYTAPQMKIKQHSLRQENIRGAFALYPGKKKEIKGKNILLVDDVATTGATIFECAKILKKHGARSVFAIVIARQG